MNEEVQHLTTRYSDSIVNKYHLQQTEALRGLQSIAKFSTTPCLLEGRHRSLETELKVILNSKTCWSLTQPWCCGCCFLKTVTNQLAKRAPISFPVKTRHDPLKKTSAPLTATKKQVKGTVHSLLLFFSNSKSICVGIVCKNNAASLRIRSLHRQILQELPNIDKVRTMSGTLKYVQVIYQCTFAFFRIWKLYSRKLGIRIDLNEKIRKQKMGSDVQRSDSREPDLSQDTFRVSWML